MAKEIILEAVKKKVEMKLILKTLGMNGIYNNGCPWNCAKTTGECNFEPTKYKYMTVDYFTEFIRIQKFKEPKCNHILV